MRAASPHPDPRNGAIVVAGHAVAGGRCQRLSSQIRRQNYGSARHGHDRADESAYKCEIPQPFPKRWDLRRFCHRIRDRDHCRDSSSGTSGRNSLRGINVRDREVMAPELKENGGSLLLGAEQSSVVKARRHSGRAHRSCRPRGVVLAVPGLTLSRDRGPGAGRSSSALLAERLRAAYVIVQQ
jgi:hypothetical protein